MTLPKDPAKYDAYIAKQRENAIKQWSDETARKKQSDAKKLQFQDPIIKEHHARGYEKRSLNTTWLENVRGANKITRQDPIWIEHTKQYNVMRVDPSKKEIRKCVDCGTESKLKYIVNFKQPKKEYRCFDCSMIKSAENRVGTYATEEARINMSMSHLGVTNEEWLGFAKNGDYCDAWTDPALKVKKRVRARFNDRCIICGMTFEQHNHKHMHVHHVYRKKDACCAGEKADWLFATLCDTCHGKYGKRQIDMLYIREILAIEYGNKCMLSLTEYNELYPNGSEGDQKWGSANGR